MRTELLTVQSSASWTQMGKAAESFPDLQQVWMSTGDERTRDDHLAAHGQVVAVGETFTVGGEEARFPRDPNLSPGQRINCRCDAVPFREEWGTTDDLLKPVNELVDGERERRQEES